MYPSIQYGFLEIKYEGEKSTPCTDEKCNRVVPPGENCFIDTWGQGKIFCHMCGKCNRYSRKKADQRGELSKPSY